MGFITYGVVFEGLIIIVLLFFIIGLLFKKNFKIGRNILWVLSGGVFILLISISLKHNHMLNEYELECVGVYKLSKESELGEYDYEDYKNVILTTKLDNTLNIKPSVPFIDLSNGKWSYFDDGDVGFMEIICNGKTSQAFGSKENWIFYNPSPIEGKQVKSIKFQRIRK